MVQFTISVTDNKAKVFLEFMKNLNFVNKIEKHNSDESFIIPQNHIDIVRERVKETEENPDRLLDWDDVKDKKIYIL